MDASYLGVKAVLMQEDVHKLEHPICCFSRKFNNAQRNYSTSEKEALGLILALQQFWFYITPAQFPIDSFTDHNPLVFHNREKQWSLVLQEYTLNIHHIPGKHNVVVDVVERILTHKLYLCNLCDYHF